MEQKKSQIVQCPGCKQKNPLKIEKIFDDFFTPLGERKLCSFCGFEFLEDHLPIATSLVPKIFDPNAERHICKYCKNYVVNPWTQRCTLWAKDVTATDTCEKFAFKKQE